jgi:hypothetical protein
MTMFRLSNEPVLVTIDSKSRPPAANRMSPGATSRRGSWESMSIIEARSPAPIPTSTRFERVWPLAFIVLALLLTFIWIGVCGYGALELMLLVF